MNQYLEIHQDSENECTRIRYLPDALRMVSATTCRIMNAIIRVPFEIVAEAGFTHHGLLASNLGKKGSTYPFAPQVIAPLGSASCPRRLGSRAGILRATTFIAPFRNRDLLGEPGDGMVASTV